MSSDAWPGQGSVDHVNMINGGFRSGVPAKTRAQRALFVGWSRRRTRVRSAFTVWSPAVWTGAEAAA